MNRDDPEGRPLSVAEPTHDTQVNEDKRFEEELYKRAIDAAERGGADDGRFLLDSIANKIYARKFDTLLFDYLADCIFQFLDDVPLERAFNVEVFKTKPKTGIHGHDRIELAAVHALVRYHACKGKEETLKWILENIDARIDRRDLQKLRDETDTNHNKRANGRPLMESWDRDLLLAVSGNLRKNLGDLFPQT